MRFYEFRQNNSGGSFEIDERAGISVLVIVEAENLSDAIDRAENIGLYFDGCEKGMDCPCCGDRWYEPWKDEGTDVPTHYDEPLALAEDAAFMTLGKWGIAWAGDKPEGYIHYANGQVVPIYTS